jgi:hypothetical protein
VANGDKQLSFTDHDLDLIRLIASKLANFISERRQNQLQKTIFKQEMEMSLLHQGLEAQSVAKVLTLAN